VSGDRPLRIHGRRFLDALTDAGIIRREDYVCRVVIDASIDSAVKVYVQRYGDERLLDAGLLSGLLAGLTVTGEEQEITR
jgi:hypothetical protein